MTTITLTAGSEEELVRKATKARAATAGALKRLSAAIRGRPYAGNITIDLTPPDLYTTPHDIHIAEDGTITAALLPNVNAHLTVKVATSSGRAFPKSREVRRRREPHLLSWGYQSNPITGGSHVESYHIGRERGGRSRL